MHNLFLLQPDYGLESAASQVVATRIVEPAAPIAIVRSNFDGPLPAFRYLLFLSLLQINVTTLSKILIEHWSHTTQQTILSQTYNS